MYNKKCTFYKAQIDFTQTKATVDKSFRSCMTSFINPSYLLWLPGLKNLQAWSGYALQRVRPNPLLTLVGMVPLWFQSNVSNASLYACSSSCFSLFYPENRSMKHTSYPSAPRANFCGRWKKLCFFLFFSQEKKASQSSKLRALGALMGLLNIIVSTFFKYYTETNIAYNLKSLYIYIFIYLCPVGSQVYMHALSVQANTSLSCCPHFEVSLSVCALLDPPLIIRKSLKHEMNLSESNNNGPHVPMQLSLIDTCHRNTNGMTSVGGRKGKESNKLLLIYSKEYIYLTGREMRYMFVGCAHQKRRERERERQWI